MKVVISQPMFFPWVGMFEQIALADVYVHYSDVQFSKGSFTNRVQIKTEKGSHWLTVPLGKVSLGQRINEVRIDDTRAWRADHIRMLLASYGEAPCVDEMMSLVRGVYTRNYETIAELSEASLSAVCDYFDLLRGRRFVHIDALSIPGASSRRVLDVVHAVGGTEYITGHGARNYLDHALFARERVSVSYMDYRKVPYEQLHGAFTPFVSILDLIANKGKAGRSLICSGTRDWKEFVEHE